MLTGEDQGSLVDDPGGAGKGSQLAMGGGGEVQSAHGEPRSLTAGDDAAG